MVGQNLHRFTDQQFCGPIILFYKISHTLYDFLFLLDFIVHFLELAGVATGGLAERVQSLQSVPRDGELFVPRVNLVQRPAVTLHFLFRAVTRLGVA